MANAIEELFRKARKSCIVGGIGIVVGAIGFILGAGYSDEANKKLDLEKSRDPNYWTLAAAKEENRKKELEAQKEKYILEQEQLKVEQENKRLSDIQEMNADAIALLDKYADPRELDDYGLIDAAYEIMDILKQEGITEQVKYRGLKRISEFKSYTEKRSTDEKLDVIIAKIERM